MLTTIQQDVDERVPYFERRRQHAGVVAIAPNSSTTAAEHAVDRLGEPRREALHATDERWLAVRLDDQVHVVGLDREVHDPEYPFAAGRERAPQDRREGFTA